MHVFKSQHHRVTQLSIKTSTASTPSRRYTKLTSNINPVSLIKTKQTSLMDGFLHDNDRKRSAFYDDIDTHNEDTFGSGALEEDWELEHNQHVELGSSNVKIGTLRSGVDIPDIGLSKLGNINDPLLSPRLNEEELERSNQELAAAVEELVLNSDQDQDAIDPAIVSLRKQAPQQYGAFASSPQLPPYYDSGKSKPFNTGDFSSLFNKKVPDELAGDKLQNIWSDTQPFDLKMLSGNTHSTNGRGFLSLPDPTAFQDEAILTAIKENSSLPGPPMLNRSTPLIVKAEDLEREMQNDAERVPSPPFGISIPKQNESDTSNDRSLPARSISPVFGSPSPSTMPIGTPPKHIIFNMMQQLEQQQKEQQKNLPHVSGSSGALSHPAVVPMHGVPPPNLSVFLNRPPPFHGARMPMPPPPPNMIWPPGMGRPPMPMNTVFAQDVINRIGMRMPGSSMLNGPRGSPHTFGPLPPHIVASQNVRRSLNMPHGGAIRDMRPLHPGMNAPDQRSPSRQPHKFGPGHLHPEHSKFVRLRQERQNNGYDRRGYNNQRSQNRVGKPGDPHANIMTQREKDWVIHIQMMALQSDRPEIDDYYYQNYIERRLRDGELNTNNHNKSKRLITPIKPNLESRKYVPVQFNNSLGKLTTSSVYNPRQIIDVVQAANQEEEGENSENRQALSKRLVVYKKIEKAYDLIVLMEEIDAALPTYDDPTERELANNDLKIKTKLIVEILGFYDMVKGDASKDPIFQLMKIRKGKKLLSRVMPFIPQNDRVLAILSILAHLPILIKRDMKDGVLQELYAPISHTISMLNVEQFLEVLTKMTAFNLTAAVRDQVGVSIVCKLLDRGRELYSSNSDFGEEKWNQFISDVADSMIAVANPKERSRHARPSTPSPLLEEFPVDIFEILAQSPIEGDDVKILRSSFERLIVSSPSTEDVESFSS